MLFGFCQFNLLKMKYIHIGETGIGSLCATGQLMQSLFQKSQFRLLLDICNLKASSSINSLDLEAFKNKEGAIDCRDFVSLFVDLNPDFIFLRLDASIKLINLQELKKSIDKPLVVSVMDDIGINQYIQESLCLASKVWFISEALMLKYKQYSSQAHCFVASNGVDTSWVRKDNFI